MEKILFISNRLRPNNNAEAFQSTMIAKYLAENCETHVISATEAPAGIGRASHHFVPSVPDNSAGSKMEHLYSKLGKNVKVRFPDSHAGWAVDAVKVASKLIADRHIDTVITRSMPVSTHLIGLELKDKHPNLRWIASLSDPIFINPYLKYSSRKLESRMADFERKIFENADTVTHSNLFAIEAYRKAYGSLSSKHIVLPNMFDRDDVVVSRHICSGAGPMILTYAGRFYGRRTPESLFKAIRLLLDSEKDVRLKLNIVGAGKSRRLDALVRKFGLSNVVEMKPFLEPDKLAEILTQSHLLVTIDGDFVGDNIFLPSKIIDYFSMTVPILGITRNGPTAAILEATNSGIWVEPEDTAGLCAVLAKHRARVKDGYDFSPDNSVVMSYHAKNVMNRFCSQVG